jgi:hypothetical protein
MANGHPVTLLCELRPSLTEDQPIEFLIGRTMALAVTIMAKGIEEWRNGGISQATLQEAGRSMERLYWLRHAALATGKLSSDFELTARSEGLRMLRKYCKGASDRVLEILVDGELEVLNRLVAAEARVN